MIDSNEAYRPELRVVGGITLDAIIRPDGTPLVGKQGGNALWASAGCLAAGGHPYLHGVIGREYPPSALEAIAAKGIDVSNISRYSGPTARVTFSYYEDGSREQPANASRVSLLPEDVQKDFLDTTRDDQVRFATLPSADDLNTDVGSNNWHLGLLPVERFVELVEKLSTADYLQADCPARFELDIKNLPELASTFEALDVFLPSTSDFDVIAPGEDPLHITRSLHDLGAKVIVLKSGADGVVVIEGGDMWHLPAWPNTSDGDPTGAGDVFCGAFASELLDGGSLVRAAALASACASLALETHEPLDVARPREAWIETRAALIEKDAKKL